MTDGPGIGTDREFKQLVDELEDIEIRRSGSGGFATTEDAARRQQVERRLMELMVTELPKDERRKFVRLACDLWVKVRLGDQEKPGMVVDVGAGGVYIQTSLIVARGDMIEVEIERRPGTMEHGLKVRGKAAWVAEAKKGARAGLGVALAATDEASERRLRRFVIELLRKRSPA